MKNFLLLLATVLLLQQAAAHQQKAAITSVLFNPRTGDIEVAHRFYLHDAEHAVRAVLNPDADIFGSAETRNDFARYVGEQFALFTTDGEPLELEAVGNEIDGNFFWVYQSIPAPGNLQGLLVEHNALRDIWPEQINTVNVERGDVLETMTFEGDAVRLPVFFPASI